MDKVYIVQFDWSTSDAGSVDLFVYGKYDNAYDKFKELICAERNPDNSWVGNIEFDDDGYPIDEHTNSSSKITIRAKRKCIGTLRTKTIGTRIPL